MKKLWSLFFICSIVMGNEFFFFDQLYYRWLGASEFKLLNTHIKFGESIKEPAGTWQLLGAVTVKNANFADHKECIFYYTPLEEKPGILKLKFLTLQQKCQDFLYNEGSLQLAGIYNLGIEVSDDFNKKYNLRMKVDDKNYDFKFINHIGHEYLSDKLDSSIVSSSFRGVTVGVPLNTREAIISKLADGQVCFDINDKCETTMDYRCQDCENSSYPIIANSCKKKYRQVCGANNCGTKNGPACIRGWVSSNYELDYCINDSPIAFCSEGLRVVCFDKVLTCQ